MSAFENVKTFRRLKPSFAAAFLTPASKGAKKAGESGSGLYACFKRKWLFHILADLGFLAGNSFLHLFLLENVIEFMEFVFRFM